MTCYSTVIDLTAMMFASSWHLTVRQFLTAIEQHDRPHLLPQAFVRMVNSVL